MGVAIGCSDVRMQSAAATYFESDTLRGQRRGCAVLRRTAPTGRATSLPSANETRQSCAQIGKGRRRSRRGACRFISGTDVDSARDWVRRSYLEVWCAAPYRGLRALGTSRLALYDVAAFAVGYTLIALAALACAVAALLRRIPHGQTVADRRAAGHIEFSDTDADARRHEATHWHLRDL